MVPDYQKLMLPILRFAGDGKEHSLSEAADAIAQHFALSNEDRKELLSSGNQKKLYNRVGWSRFYLLKAGILEAALITSSAASRHCVWSCAVWVRLTMSFTNSGPNGSVRLLQSIYR